MAYDADCGPCTRFKQAIDFLDMHHRIEFISLVEADKRGLLEEVPLQRRFRSMHFISPDGEIWSSANALPTILRLLPFGGVVATLMTSVPGMMSLTRFVYSTFARLHDLGSCRYTPVAVRAHSPGY